MTESIIDQTVLENLPNDVLEETFDHVNALLVRLQARATKADDVVAIYADDATARLAGWVERVATPLALERRRRENLEPEDFTE